MVQNIYNEQPDEDDDIMTVAEFIEYCKMGDLIDYDGFGSPVKDGLIGSMTIYPSRRNDIPKDATHIVWYNR